MLAILFAAAVSFYPCEVQEVKVQCGGTFRASDGVPLHFVVLPAKEKSSDALFILAGGPGVGATNMTSFVSGTFTNIGRDVVLVDARGTGKSNPLKCEQPPDDPFADLFEPARMAACRDQLAKTSDLTRYTTRHVVEDLETVRKALGYRTVTLYGTSYGTRVAQEYMRRYPKNIRAVILDGVVPPSAAMPSHYAPYADRSLQRVLAICKRDDACRAAYPDLDADLAKMLAAADRGIEIDGHTLRRGFFGEAFRNFLYSPSAYSQLPLVIHSAANGDWTRLADMARNYSRNIRSIELGFFLSVTCAEDIPRVNEAAVRATAKGTLLGTYRLDQQLGACRVWPRAAVDKASTQPVRSPIPTLLLSGEVDPVTPPEFGDEVAKTLKHALHVVVPEGSHGGTDACMDALLSEFVREGSVDALQTACVKESKHPPFVTKTP
ncbi:MAG TPA: alpha/beta hydrolase [Thermoanaerobaculia bacterium]|nr:alpha/beta hydrolase [Thermoanaerobaculia bacterium]